MPKGQRNKPEEAVEPTQVEMVDAASEIAPEPIAEVVAPPAAPVASKQPTEDLAAYAKRIERIAQPLAVCIITHPDAVDGAIFEGVYAGIRLVNGPELSARLSDGNTI